MMKKANKLYLSKKSRYRVDSEDEDEKQKSRLEENSPEATPERSSSPDSMMLCTQTDQVLWNWHSPKAHDSPAPGAKKKKSKPPAKVTTPKNTQVKDPRNAESPLMYSKKRSVIKSEDMESVNNLLNSMNTITEACQNPAKEPETEPPDVAPPAISTTPTRNPQSTGSRIPAPSFRQSPKLQPAPSPSRRLAKVPSFDHLLNDSMDEFLVQCSQELESRLVPETGGATSRDPAKRRSTSPRRVLDSEPKKPRNAGISLPFPDDAFDECLAGVLENWDSSRQGKSGPGNAQTARNGTPPRSSMTSSYTSSTRCPITPNKRKFIRASSSPVSSSSGVRLQKHGSFDESRSRQEANDKRSAFGGGGEAGGGVRSKAEIEKKRLAALKIREEKEKLRLQKNGWLVKR